MERERSAGPAFDLATERRKREIEALPFEPRMTVERILFTAEKDKQRADEDRAKRADVQLEVFRQQALIGTLAPHLRPDGIRHGRPPRMQAETDARRALEKYMTAAKQHDDARIDGRAAQKVDALLALNRGRSETAEERVKKEQQRDVPQMGDPGYAQWREQQKSRGRER